LRSALFKQAECETKARWQRCNRESQITELIATPLARASDRLLIWVGIGAGADVVPPQRSALYSCFTRLAHIF